MGPAADPKADYKLRLIDAGSGPEGRARRRRIARGGKGATFWWWEEVGGSEEDRGGGFAEGLGAYREGEGEVDGAGEGEGGGEEARREGLGGAG